MPAADIRLHDPDTFRDGIPHDCFRHLRDRAPVFWQTTVGEDGFWAVTRHDDVLRVLKDPSTFSSERGNMLRVRLTADPGAGKMLVVTDPPRHGRLREAVNAGFSPSRLRALADHVQVTADELVERFVQAGGGDFVAAVATPLPLRVIGELLGVPPADRAALARLTNVAFTEVEPDEPAAESVMDAHLGLLTYLDDLVRARRSRPGADLVSVLQRAEVEGARLTDEEVIYNCFNLLIGGQTTRHAASGGMLALVEHPDQARALRDAPETPGTAVDELVRWSSPSLHVLRTVTRDAQIGEQMVRAGQSVTAWLAAANFDERQHREPLTFSVERSPNRHLTFSSGPHQCLGAPLARLELSALVRSALPWLARMRVAGPIEHVSSTFTHAVARLDLTVG